MLTVQRTNHVFALALDLDKAGFGEFAKVLGNGGRDFLRAGNLATDCSGRGTNGPVGACDCTFATGLRQEFHDPQSGWVT